MSPFGRLTRMRVAPRVAILLIVSILIAGMVESLIRTVLPPAPQMNVERSWLSDTMEEAAFVAASTPKDRRQQALSGLPSSRIFDYRVVPDIPVNAPGGPFRYKPDGPHLILLARHLGDDLIQDAFSSRALTDLQLAVLLPDGGWLVAQQRKGASVSSPHALYLLAFVGRLLAIALFSYFMARMILRPLTTLSKAAERMGREREPTLVMGMRAPEYVAIADTFNEMQLRLKRHIDGRTQMLAAISHDLRTPLTRLRLLAEYVPPAQRERMLSDIGDMEAMLSDALALASAEMRREPEQIIDLAALLISLADTFADAGQQAHYEGPDHLRLRCRPIGMKRAFTNLIANGCQYGEAVTIHLAETRDGVIVDIVDRGPGIPPELADRAFEPFERLEASRSRETGGTGLGLAIVREAVSGQGGTVAFLQAEAGFTVRVSLPK